MSVTLEALTIEPNPSGISDPFSMDLEFALDKDVSDAYWEFKYVIDVAMKRHIVVLGQTEKEDFENGSNFVSFSCGDIDLSSFPSADLTNCGLLVATLKQEDTEICDVQMVVVISKEGENYMRSVLSPLE